MRLRKLDRQLGAWLCAIVITAFAAPVIADAKLTSGGMNLQLFRPAVDSRGHFSVNGTDVVPHKRYTFGLLMDGGFRMLDFQGYCDSTMTSAADADRQAEMQDNDFSG